MFPLPSPRHRQAKPGRCWRWRGPLSSLHGGARCGVDNPVWWLGIGPGRNDTWAEHITDSTCGGGGQLGSAQIRPFGAMGVMAAARGADPVVAAMEQLLVFDDTAAGNGHACGGFGGRSGSWRR